ncbi:MAG: hypothetical protein ACLQPV_09695 [Vulcanimicrobiaceae bacterium]
MESGGRIRFLEYLAIFGTGLAGAVGLTYAFAGIHYNVSLSAEAAGYVDPAWQMGVLLGYAVLLGGAATSGAVAVWAAVRAVRIAARERRAGAGWGEIFRSRER